MPSLDQFTRRINIVARNVETNVNRMMQRCALAVDQVLVLETPVDTGRARSNWRVSLGSPTFTTREAYSPIPSGFDPGKKGEGANAAAAILHARTAVEGRKPEQTIYISNNVDYIGELAEGKSPQNPTPGWIDRGVRAGVDAITRTRIVR